MAGSLERQAFFKETIFMKPYFLMLIIISCSKDVEKPVKPEPISFTQTRLMHDINNTYIGTLDVIHFHRVEAPNLIAQYKALPAFQPFCDDWNDTLITVLGKVCKEDCGLK